MTTTTILDLRRQDTRDSVSGGMYWITSATITPLADDLAALLFSFPITKSVSRGFRPFFIEQVVFEVITAFAGGTITLDIGSGTLATDAVTTAGVVTEVDIDEYLDNTDITHGTAGWYPAGKTGTDPDWITIKILGAGVMPYYHDPADTTVPCIYATLLSDAAITTGGGRVHLLINEVPPWEGS